MSTLERAIPLVFVVLSMSACFSRASVPDPVVPSPEYEVAAEVFVPLTSPPSPAARVFLLAGSSENANFAQEVVDQRHYWIERGIPEEAITCFYIPPYQEEFEGDAEQFRALRDDLSACHLATVPALREHLAVAAREAGDDAFLYLYVTSHGMAPAGQKLERLERGESGYWHYRRLSRYDTLNRHQLVVESLPDGPAGQIEKIGALRAGASPDDLFLTPGNLRSMLAEPWQGVPKIVVLQGCYSGGFIDDPADPRPEERLSTLTNITVLTASRYDRVSFGCGSSEERTYFGGFLQDVLNEHPALPLEQDWRSVFAETARRVDELETVAGEEPSLPGFYSDR